MKLKIKRIGFLTGTPVCIIHEDTLKEMDLHVGDRVSVAKKSNKIIAILDSVSRGLRRNEILVSKAIIDRLEVRDKEFVEVEIAEKPHSITLIKKKLKGERLKKKEIFEIVENVANNSLTEAEVAFFISAVYSEGMTLSETKYLTDAMVASGNTLKIKGKIVDKHSIGGVAGNRTTPILVSICAAAGLTIPKTSSRAITSAAGTADVIETISRVDFPIKEIKKMVRKTGACFVWGGALGLAPVDDKIIRIERIVNIDSTAQLLASILSKKISVGSKYILIDIPYGNSAKVSKKEAEKLKSRFMKIGNMSGLKLDVVLTDGSEPIGNGVGPLLEIKDVISVLERKNPPKDLEEKSVLLAGRLLELSGKEKQGNGIKKAQLILDSGKALNKFKEIIRAQKGSLNKLKKLQPEFSYTIRAKSIQVIKHIDNKYLNKMARIAGSPDDKPSGIYLHKKKNQLVRRGEEILTIYTLSRDKLRHAKRFYKENKDKIIHSV